MALFAQIVGGKVAVMAWSVTSPGAGWIAAPDGAAVGWTYNGSAFAQAGPTLLAPIIAAGCRIQSASNPVLNTTWALDEETLTEIGSVARDSAAGLGLPMGASVFQYPDKSGMPVACTPAQMQLLYKALRDYVAASQGYAAGKIAQPPAQPFVIA